MVSPAWAQNITLGTAADFGVLGGSTVTNTGATVITGNVGVAPGTSITGFPPGTIFPGSGSLHSNDPVAQQAQADLTVAYGDAVGLPCPAANDLTGRILGSGGTVLTLAPGVYCFASSAQLTGDLILNGSGVYVFQIGSTLTTATASSITLSNGASACGVFWQVGSSATIGTNTAMAGSILALTSITVTAAATVDGRLLARGGAVTLDSNTVTACTDLVTEASSAVSIGGAINDTGTLSGGTNPTGTITFQLFGPDNAACSGAPVFTSTVPVAGNGSYPSVNFTPIAVGTYRWIANYSGDASNAATANTCNGANESVLVSQAAPTLITTASAGVPLGATISDTAVLSGGINPTGTITFRLFDPNDASCSNLAIFTSTVTVAGNGSYLSGNFTPGAIGTYRWIASYSGDAGNAAAATVCNDANESVVVSQALPAMVTQASANVGVGGAIHDTAILSGGVNATGTITFTLFGPNNATCSGAPAFTSTIPVAGNGSYLSGNFTPPRSVPIDGSPATAATQAMPLRPPHATTPTRAS